MCNCQWKKGMCLFNWPKLYHVAEKNRCHLVPERWQLGSQRSFSLALHGNLVDLLTKSFPGQCRHGLCCTQTLSGSLKWKRKMLITCFGRPAWVNICQPISKATARDRTLQWFGNRWDLPEWEHCTPSSRKCLFLENWGFREIFVEKPAVRKWITCFLQELLLFDGCLP